MKKIKSEVGIKHGKKGRKSETLLVVVGGAGISFANYIQDNIGIDVLQLTATRVHEALGIKKRY